MEDARMSIPPNGDVGSKNEGKAAPFTFVCPSGLNVLFRLVSKGGSARTHGMSVYVGDDMVRSFTLAFGSAPNGVIYAGETAVQYTLQALSHPPGQGNLWTPSTVSGVTVTPGAGINQEWLLSLGATDGKVAQVSLQLKKTPY